MSLLSLFVSGLVAATILPGASELLFAQQVLANPQQVLLLWLAVSLGNSLGGIITFYMGVGMARLGSNWHMAKKLRIQPPKESVLRGLQHYGRWLLLLTWLPVVGDAIALAAGMLGWPRWSSLILIALGKAARYGALAWIITG
jgi:membrane protein YqaA with SNARE-associated domain